MAVLVDANILVRILDRASSEFPECSTALRVANARRGEFFVCAQATIEFWVVVTRPVGANGLGLTPSQAEAALVEFDRFLPMLPEPSDVGERWRRLVSTHGVSGRPAHDARLVALMEAHGIRDLLSLNARDFARYPSIRIVSPQEVIDGKV